MIDIGHTIVVKERYPNTVNHGKRTVVHRSS